MGPFVNIDYRDTLVDFPHLLPDSSMLTVVSSPKYYANNELFKIFNTFKLEVLLLGQGIAMKHNHNKCLVGVWALGSLILINYFGSDLQALEVSEQTLKIESIRQLIDRQDIDVMVPKNTYIGIYLKK
ncbi:unnamed protein product, partial [Oppiella nova]